MELTAKEFLKGKGILEIQDCVQGYLQHDSGSECVVYGLDELIEEYHQAKLKESKARILKSIKEESKKRKEEFKGSGWIKYNNY